RLPVPHYFPTRRSSDLDRDQTSAIAPTADAKGGEQIGNRFARALATDAGPSGKSIVRRTAKRSPAECAGFRRPATGTFGIDSIGLHRHPCRQVAPGTTRPILFADF